MTKVSKVLTVFLSVASLAFVAFALVRAAGGPNWSAEIKSPDLDLYTFALSEDENPQWTVTQRFGGKQTVQGTPTPVLAEAVLAARKDLETYQKQQIADIDQRMSGNPEQGVPELAVRIADIRQSQAQDVQALAAREQQTIAKLEQLEQRVKQVSEELTVLSRETTNTRREVGRRREDVIRLTNQLDELRTDRFRLTELRKTLTDRLVRLKISNETLAERNTQMKDQLQTN